jgi:hypothetical protein
MLKHDLRLYRTRMDGPVFPGVLIITGVLLVLFFGGGGLVDFMTPEGSGYLGAYLAVVAGLEVLNIVLHNTHFLTTAKGSQKNLMKKIAELDSRQYKALGFGSRKASKLSASECREAMEKIDEFLRIDHERQETSSKGREILAGLDDKVA